MKAAINLLRKHLFPRFESEKWMTVRESDINWKIAEIKRLRAENERLINIIKNDLHSNNL